MRYPHLFSRLFNTPLLLTLDKAAVIEAVFRSRLDAIPQTIAELSDVKPVIEAATLPGGRPSKPYSMTEGGIALLPVMGTLVQRSSWMDAASGMTGYPSIASKLDAALNDPDVKGILLEVDSGGGEASGVFDLADKIFAARDQKPIWAIANEQAYSAAYAIASSAEKLVLPRTGGLGSIGVIALHVDQSAKNEKAGLTYTAIHAGAKKNDLTSHKPLSDGARADLQAEIDRLYGLFTDTVARNRGLSVDVVKATEAGLMNPDQAVASGFADSVATLEQTIADFEAAVTPTTTIFSTTASHAGISKEAQMPQSQAPAAGTADQTPDVSAIAASARAEGAQAERARIAHILNCEHSNGRSAMASMLALETDMTAEQAEKLLSKSPIEQTQASVSQFHVAMSQVNNPQVGADADVGMDTPEAQAHQLAQKILNAGKLVSR